MDAAPAPRLYMDRLVRPTRSLSRQGVILLLAPFAFVNLAFGVMWHIAGAALVPVFLGLDVLLLSLALWANFQAAKSGERVRVSADEISVAWETPRSRRTLWTSATAFTRVDLLDAEKHGARVRLSSKGATATVAAALSPRERAAFARALQEAVRDARAERW
ncbi:MAG TPA: DUF2244 domain-containing protein [Caulobacteraceae bacterium]|nr:DUF2244 domain-containing protein [Caulobacteraceae bacterium]